MTLYTHLTELALNHTASPSQAWENAVQTLAARGIGTTSSQGKGCPKAAFVGLAEHGYIRGFAASSDKPMRENARHALCAYTDSVRLPYSRNPTACPSISRNPYFLPLAPLGLDPKTTGFNRNPYYRLYLADPSLLDRKPLWWQAVAAERGISRKGQNGVLDVMTALIQHDAFLPAAGTASL